MRLAQRAHRARKQASQESERIRAEKFSRGLDDTLATYSGLHQRILDSVRSRNSSDILLYLNDAGTCMAAIASSTNKVFAWPTVLEDLSPGSR